MKVGSGMDTQFVDIPTNDCYKVYEDDGLHFEIIYSRISDCWFITEHKTFIADDFGKNMRRVYNPVGSR